MDASRVQQVSRFELDCWRHGVFYTRRRVNSRMTNGKISHTAVKLVYLRDTAVGPFIEGLSADLGT